MRCHHSFLQLSFLLERVSVSTMSMSAGAVAGLVVVVVFLVGLSVIASCFLCKSCCCYDLLRTGSNMTSSDLLHLPVRQSAAPQTRKEKVDSTEREMTEQELPTHPAADLPVGSLHFSSQEYVSTL